MKLDDKKKKALLEIFAYVFFGVLTTVVSMVTYFVIIWMGERMLSLDPNSGSFYAVRVVAQILQWVFAVLFAFYTNKKWVFTSADQNVSTWKQLLTFSGSRLVTLGMDTAVTLGAVAILQGTSYETVEMNFIIKIPLTADVIAKIAAAVVVIIANYILSKLFVFRSAKEDRIKK